MTEQAFALERFEPDWVVAPGETIAEFLEEKSITQRELALRMGVTPKFVNHLLAGQAPISKETALKLERVLGGDARFWLRLELQYREGLARREELVEAEGWVSWLQGKPYKELMKVGLIPERRATKAEKPRIVLDLLRYFGAASPDDWNNTYASMQAQFRRTQTRASDDMAVAAWLRMGVQVAQKISTAPYSKKKFIQVLEEVRTFTVHDPSIWQHQLMDLCASAGVAVAFVPALPTSGVSGVARWMSSDKALIQLSLYGKSNDKLWFTFFHEAAHLLFHAKKSIFLDSLDAKADVDELEAEANKYARDVLIPPKWAKELSSLLGEDDIRRFANELGIHSGIVVGRMQYDRIIDFHQFNHLKDRYEFTGS